MLKKNTPHEDLPNVPTRSKLLDIPKLVRTKISKPYIHTHTPAAVVVPTHKHLSAPTADGAVGLVAVIVVLIRALQEAVLHAT